MKREREWVSDRWEGNEPRGREVESRECRMKSEKGNMREIELNGSNFYISDSLRVYFLHGPVFTFNKVLRVLFLHLKMHFLPPLYFRCGFFPFFHLS